MPQIWPAVVQFASVWQLPATQLPAVSQMYMPAYAVAQFVSSLGSLQGVQTLETQRPVVAPVVHAVSVPVHATETSAASAASAPSDVIEPSFELESCAEVPIPLESMPDVTSIPLPSLLALPSVPPSPPATDASSPPQPLPTMLTHPTTKPPASKSVPKRRCLIRWKLIAVPS